MQSGPSNHKQRGSSTAPPSGKMGGVEPPATSSSALMVRKVPPVTSPSSDRRSNVSESWRDDGIKPIWYGYLLGLLGVALLILLGGGDNVYALSLSLILPGLALLLHPPAHGLGLWIDRIALAFLAFLLLAFIPQFYWPDPDWRTAATEVFGVNLPASLSIHPLISLEAWVSAVAGFAWLYAASSWRINNEGRNWFYFVLCLVVCALSAILLWGNLSGIKYPSAKDSEVFTFFPNWNQTANFLAVGGVTAFGYFMCALSSYRLMPIIGLFASALSFLILFLLGSRDGVLLFCAGILIGYVLQLFSGCISAGMKFGLPLALAVFSLVVLTNSQLTSRVTNFLIYPDNGSENSLGLLAKDAFGMIKDAPLSGHGLGTFSSILPQYREVSASHRPATHLGSDILWLTTDTGVLGLLLFLGFIYFYFVRCRGLTLDLSASYRLAALASLILFMLHALVNDSCHSPGTVYFAILLAAFALPLSKEKQRTFSPRIWRGCGGLLVFVGILWGLSGLSGLPLHSAVAQSNYEDEIKESLSESDYDSVLSAFDDWIELRPLDWSPYFQRASFLLTQIGDVEKAAADFKRARFVEPTLGTVVVEEGFLWIPYDVSRAIDAWREVFLRELQNREATFSSMKKAATQNPELMDALLLLSNRDLSFRAFLLEDQPRELLMKEINRDLDINSSLGHYSREQRTSIVKIWIEQGDYAAAEAFLEKNEINLDRPWWLWSLLRKKQANFEDAASVIRDTIEPPVIPESSFKGVSSERLERDLRVSPGDVMRSTALLQIYLENKNFEKVNELTQSMASSQKQVPLYFSYWEAESFFRLQDYIESWYAFERYLKRIWAEE